MLIWYKELEQDERLLKYATDYANALLKIQDPQGFSLHGWTQKHLNHYRHYNNRPKLLSRQLFCSSCLTVTNDASVQNCCTESH